MYSCPNYFKYLDGPCTREDVGEVELRSVVRITDLDFADDAVIFAKTTEVLAGALDSLNEEPDPLGLRVSLIKRPRSMRSVTSWMRQLGKFL